MQMITSMRVVTTETNNNLSEMVNNSTFSVKHLYLAFPTIFKIE